MTPPTTIGCSECFQATPETGWQSRQAFRLVEELIDESHFRVLLLECPACGQRSVSVFSETIDWANGDDAQYWRLVPVTAEESQRLIAAGEAACVSELAAMATDRCHLVINHPTGGEQSIFWSHVFIIHPHD